MGRRRRAGGADRRAAGSRPSAGGWSIRPLVAAAVDQLRDRLAGGVEVADLTDRERALLDTVDDAVVDGTRARLRGTVDPLAEHPVIAALAAGGLAPSEPDARPADLRELARRGVLFERDGLWWHVDAIDCGVGARRRLVAADADGFTVSEFREAAGSPASTPCRC